MRLIFAWSARFMAGAALIGLLGLSPAGYVGERTETPLERVSLGPKQAVQTTDSRVCLHTRATDEVEEGKIRLTFEMAREMGASTVVEYLPWAYVEREQGKYDWSHPDRILKHIEQQGLEPIIRLGYVPDWLLPDEDEAGYTNANFVTQEALDAYAEYVGVFVGRYAGRVNKIIIWNEPNLNMEWTAGGADPIAYTALLKKAYLAAKAANPDVMVLGGALAPTNEPPHGAGGWNDLDFLAEMYKAGAAPYFDALAAHVYGFKQPPQAEPAYDALNFRRVELLHEVMKDYGDGDKLIYVTEGGWNDHPRWIHGVRPGQRIAYTLDAYAYIRDNMPWLQTFCLWAFRYPVPTNSYPDYFTYLSPRFDPKPIYLALQAYARGWEMPEWLRAES